MKKKEFTRKILEYNRELFDLLESISGKVVPEEFFGKVIAFREEVKIGGDIYKFDLLVKDHRPTYKPELSIYRDIDLLLALKDEDSFRTSLRHGGVTHKGNGGCGRTA